MTNNIYDIDSLELTTTNGKLTQMEYDGAPYSEDDPADYLETFEGGVLL